MNILLDGLFPQYCALCGLRSLESQPLCHGCAGDLVPNTDSCLQCAIPLAGLFPSTATGMERRCGRCLSHPPAFSRARVPWLYDDQIAFLIQRWKFGGQRQLTGLLARLWLQRCHKTSDVDVLVPVPLHWRRIMRRGFNQSELVCRELQRLSPELHDTPVARMVRRSRATAAQSGMDARQRAGNLRNAFTVKEPCDNLRIAVVDDVLTTGATAQAMAQALRAAGASDVEIWCLARTPAPGYR
tara:strand:- start:394935 stop:395660 length:726 start_codon:yes stop_codon:yes gene_type:complete